MNKEDLTKLVAKEVEINQETGKNAINAFVEGISTSLEKGEAITLIGFGTLKVVERKARKGRNPQTGKEIDIPASKAVKFSIGKNLKDKVNVKKEEVKKEEVKKETKAKAKKK